MRQLLITIGAPGAGKSTWIRDMGLADYTVCPDTIRILYSSPKLTIDGNFVRSLDYDSDVWRITREIVEARMSHGDFTVVDATHTRRKYINQWIKLARRYRYRSYYIRFDVPLQELLRRNRNRPDIDWVPEDQIKLHYERLQSLQIPSSINELKTIADISSNVTFYDYFERFRSIYVIGDIHGVRKPLEQFLDRYYNAEDVFIFIGDYIDRGKENVWVLNKLNELYKKGNIALVEGNHEKWLWMYLTASEPEDLLKIHSRQFKNYTMKELDEAKIDRGEMRELMRHMRPFLSIKFGGVKLLITHGGVPIVGIGMAAANDAINGVGEYEDVEKVADSFSARVKDEKIIQIFGHRNLTNLPIIIDEHNILLEGKIEVGGELRAVNIDKNGAISPIAIPSDYVFQNALPTSINDDNILTIAKENKKIKLKQSDKYRVIVPKFGIGQGGLIRSAFYNSKDEMVARTYNKFGYIRNLSKLSYPVTAFQKENGFLGVVGYDKDIDELVFASKTSTQGQFAKWVEEVFTPIQKQTMKYFLAHHNYTLLFEIILPEKDPHIIKYYHDGAVLLDAVRNSVKFELMSHYELEERFSSVFLVKRLLGIYHTREELEDAIKAEFGVPKMEGAVLHDNAGNLYKHKTEYYNKWKMARRLANDFRKLQYIETTNIFDVEIMQFFAWLKKTTPQDQLKDKLSQPIIALRDEYENFKEGKITALSRKPNR